MSEQPRNYAPTGKNKLLQQIIRFGFVGILSFFVDFGVYNVLCNLLGVHYLVAGGVGFVVSVIVNYLLSMKFVFEGRDDISKTREFITFVFLSVIGLGGNELVLFISIDGIYYHWTWLSSWLAIGWANAIAKLGATAIVMIYNFITRKIFLEKH